jgi:hypothetical protein
LETGILSQANGSCLLRVHGGSSVVVGISAQIKSVIDGIDAEELADDVDRDQESSIKSGGGRVECFVEW